MNITNAHQTYCRGEAHLSPSADSLGAFRGIVLGCVLGASLWGGIIALVVH